MSTSVEQPHGATFQSRNIRLDGKRTSIRLENAMWEAFEEIAAREGKNIGELCVIIASRKNGSNLTAAVRLFIIVYFRIAVRGDNRDGKAAPGRLAARREARNNGFSALMASALAVLE